MKTLGRRESVALGIVLMIVVIAAGWFFLVKPASAKVSDLKAQATEQENTNDATRTQIAALQAAKKKLPQEQAELAQLTQKVPSTVQLPNLLRAIQDLATTAGVTLNGITPTAATPLSGADGISSVGITLVVTGGYAEVEEFDHSLEGLSRAFLVSGFSLTQSTDSSGAGPTGTSTDTVTADQTVSATLNGRILVSTLTSGAPTTSTTN